MWAPTEYPRQKPSWVYVPRDSTVGPPKASGPTYKTSDESGNPVLAKTLSKQMDSPNSLQDPRCSGSLHTSYDNEMTPGC